MKITPSQLNVIQQKASTLIERYASAMIRGEVMDELPLHQLWEWDQRLSGQYAQSLLKRLSLFGDLQPQIAEVQHKYEHDLKNQSGWISEFRKILKYYNTDVLHSPPLEFRETKPEAFQSLLIPFVWYAMNSLTNNQEFSGHLSTRDTLIAHCRSILKVLSKISSPCFFSAFDDFRKTHGHRAKKKTDNALYQKFETSMFADGIIGFFEEYSSLARLLTTVTQQWILSTQLMIERLQSDHDDIASTFFKGRPMGALKSIKCGLSAPHAADGLVFELEFSHGGKVMYKPRSGNVDLALSSMISWLNTCGDLEPMRAVMVLDRTLYSWHEYIGWRACQSKLEVEQYYTQIGQQAALLHLLGSTDYHFDNLRACGAHPYLTDNETLLSPYLKISEDHVLTGDAVLDAGIVHSLARSLFLLDTRKLLYPDPESISGVFDSRDRFQVIGYRNVNTDSMYPAKRYQTRRGNNIPKLGRHLVNPRQYVPSIKKGYAATLLLINVRREEFHTLVESATSHFNLEVRMLVRPTKVYAQILFESLRPEFLRDGVERSLLFEKLARFYLTSYSLQESGKLLYKEIAMLQDHLVPWFHVQMNQGAWCQTVDNRSVIHMTSQQVFEENLRRLDSNFIELHVGAIDHYLERPHATSYDIASTPAQHQSDSATGLFSTMCAVAQNLHYCYRHFYPLSAIDTLTQNGNRDLYRHYAFNNGLLGVLVTLAYFEPYLKESCRETIYVLLKPLEDSIKISRASKHQNTESSGWTEEVGSVIYGLMALGDALKDNNLHTLAFELAASSPAPFSIRLDHSFSSYTDYALVLAKLCKLKPDQNNRHILQDYLDQILLAYDDKGNQKQSHSADIMGTLNACCAVYHVTGDNILKSRIAELYERARKYCQKEMDVYAHALPGKGPFRNPDVTSFSKGFAGRLVVLIKADRILNSNQADKTLMKAAQKLLHIIDDDTDNISTGIAGRCQPALLLGDLLAGDLDRLTDMWHLRWTALQTYILTPHYLNPFFMEGISGVLYQQLRLLFRKDTPSLLCFE